MAIYIKSLKIKNIRTFSDAELKLEKEDGTLPQWTLILGDNGIGKSTLLHCMAWMKPYLPYDEGAMKKSEIEPYINDEENETLQSLVRKRKANENVSAFIQAVFVGKRKLGKKTLAVEASCITEIEIKVKNGKLDDVFTSFDTKPRKEKLFYQKEIIIYAYSASRSLGTLNINDPDLEDTIPSFIDEQTELFDAESILHTSHYAALGAKTQKEKREYNNYIERIKEMLVSILPDINDIKHIEISAPKLLDDYEPEGNIVLTTRHGIKLPFKNASLGYRTTISWTVDLAWRLFKEYPKSKNPLEEPAIVLIDEIDLHLHPKWQREIMANLSKHFPNVQFIATAHSPLMVQAAINSNYSVLKQNEDEEVVQIVNEPKGIDGWRVDQILTSEFFDLQSSRGVEYEKLINERSRLEKKRNLTQAEKKQLKQIESKLSKLPTGENRQEIENRELISKVVQEIRKNKIKIEL